MSAKLIDKSEEKATEAIELKEELCKVRVAETKTKQKLLDFLSKNPYTNKVYINYYYFYYYIQKNY